jgi:aryl-alcohol dehydrogenase-like predicted oxidoreductase
MIYTLLGNTGVKVSKICLGTMTWGEQNTEAEAHEQLDYALDAGINFIDTAELYAIPSRPETYGSTERYIGSWIASRKNRDKFVLASKVSGPGPKHIRGGPNFSRKQLTQALDASLKRLQTDFFDLYQLHWPERKTNYFGHLGYVHKEEDPWNDNFTDILQTMREFINQGKIRFFGVSNETPWGLMRTISLAEKHDLPKPVSIQNPYNLLNRTYEVGLAEISHRENCGLLAYSPLAFGLLTGKYFRKEKVGNSRITLYKQLARYNNERSMRAARKYVELADAFNISPAQMALAYVNGRSFVDCNIIGATTMDQLKENIESHKISLLPELIGGIEEIHLEIPNPAP